MKLPSTCLVFGVLTLNTVLTPVHLVLLLLVVHTLRQWGLKELEEGIMSVDGLVVSTVDARSARMSRVLGDVFLHRESRGSWLRLAPGDS